MSDGATNVDQVGAERAQAVAQEANASGELAPEQNQVDLDGLKVAIVAGITPKGNFVFDLVAQNPEDKNVLTLLALGRYVQEEVTKTFNATRSSGDALTAQLGNAMNVLNSKLDQLVEASNKPDISL